MFNSSKGQIRQPQIAFYSAVFTNKGMQPGPFKIQFLQDLPTPNSPVKPQPFLGQIHYLQTLILGLSHKSMYLLEQLAKWDWNPSIDAAFECLKPWICQTLLITTIVYYDWSKLVITQTDASEYGLGAAFLQSSWPIAFTNKTLADIKTHYANIEQECVSVWFGLKNFHTYLYGRHVIIQNDHKPLEMTKQKPIHPAPACLQCMLLHMQKYNYTIQYNTGKEMVLANNLSHFSSLKESLPIPIHQNI